MQRILHLVRYCASFVPGGQALARMVLGWMSVRQNKKCRALLQARGFEICSKIHEALTAAGIKYFADHGTLLGLIRENGMIAHDTDMDFSIPPDQSVQAVYATLSKVGFSLVHGFALHGEVQEITVAYGGITIDFFKCHSIGDDLGHYVFCPQYDMKRGVLTGVMAHERRRPPLKGLEVREFGTHMKARISIPTNAIEYLTASYGNWQVPDSTTDFCSDKIPTQYQDIFEGCEMLNAEQLRAAYRL